MSRGRGRACGHALSESAVRVGHVCAPACVSATLSCGPRSSCHRSCVRLKRACCCDACKHSSSLRDVRLGAS